MEELNFYIFLGSSAVERSAVNRLVAGSNPARGVSTHFHKLSETSKSLFCLSEKGLSTILGSSAVERSAVNRLVAGSNPARGVF